MQEDWRLTVRVSDVSDLETQGGGARGARGAAPDPAGPACTCAGNPLSIAPLPRLSLWCVFPAGCSERENEGNSKIKKKEHKEKQLRVYMYIVCIHTYIYIYIYIYTHTHTHTHIYICIYAYINIYTVKLPDHLHIQGHKKGTYKSICKSHTSFSFCLSFSLSLCVCVSLSLSLSNVTHTRAYVRVTPLFPWSCCHRGSVFTTSVFTTSVFTTSVFTTTTMQESHLFFPGLVATYSLWTYVYSL